MIMINLISAESEISVGKEKVKYKERKRKRNNCIFCFVLPVASPCSSR